jgi:choline dehydrogenase-like flavoprotein
MTGTPRRSATRAVARSPMTDRRVLVIGSGPAGAMMAHQLVSRGVPVTMLEAGLTPPTGLLLRIADRNLVRKIPPAEVLSDESAPAPERSAVWIRHMSHGGLTNQWTGAVPRFTGEDFTEGARLHERYEWPIRYADLEPYYTIAELLIGVSGQAGDLPNLPSGVITYGRRLPKDWHPMVKQAAARGQGMAPIPIADGPPTMLVRRGTAFNSYSVIVEPLLASPHFRFLAGAHALELEWSAKDGRVRSVVYHDRTDGQEKRLEAAAVVLAAGPLNSTKLLLNSTSPDFPQGLGNSGGLLGQHLHDHIRDWWACDMERPVTLLSSAAYLTRRPFASSTPLLATSWTLGVASTKDRIRSRAGLKSTELGVQVFGTTVPDERNFVRPSATRRDEFGRPELDVRMQFGADEVQTVMDARQRLMELFQDAGCRATLRSAPTVLTPGDSVHFGGSIRMHASPRFGVTDGWNRLYDAPNVLACDASCFTTGPEKNPTLTVMAIAARAADRLAEDLKQDAAGLSHARR